MYAVARGKPHVRVENRVLPAGPTVVDTIANAAFWYGLVRGLAELDEPIESQLSFSAAQDNFFSAATDGIEATLYWPGVGEVPATELVLRTLLPLAHTGLDAWRVDRRDRDHYLGIIEQRCLKRRNGATWQVDAYRGHVAAGTDRAAALEAMTSAAYQSTCKPRLARPTAGASRSAQAIRPKRSWAAEMPAIVPGTAT